MVLLDLKNGKVARSGCSSKKMVQGSLLDKREPLFMSRMSISNECHGKHGALWNLSLRNVDQSFVIGAHETLGLMDGKSRTVKYHGERTTVLFGQ